MGQSSGWLISRNSSTPLWYFPTWSVVVLMTMPSATYTAQAGCSFGIFSTSTRHIRQTATGAIFGCEQKIGMSIPIFLAASRISVPFGTVTDWPLMLSVTWSVCTVAISVAPRAGADGSRPRPSRPRRRRARERAHPWMRKRTRAGDDNGIRRYSADETSSRSRGATLCDRLLHRLLEGAAFFGDVLLELVAEELDDAAWEPGRGITQRAERPAVDTVPDVE